MFNIMFNQEETTTMVKKPAPRVVREAAVAEYHVYDPNFKEVGGTFVVDRDDGARVIRLTAKQAQSLVEQGTIGPAAFDTLSEASQNARKMFRGEAI